MNSFFTIRQRTKIYWAIFASVIWGKKIIGKTETSITVADIKVYLKTNVSLFFFALALQFYLN